MNSQGWIKIYRKIQESALWEIDEPYDKRSAFIDLLLMANHTDKQVVFDGKVITVKSGQKLLSIRFLSERWGWSTNKVLRYFKLLEDLDIIQRESDNKKTLLTIVNYGFYQDCRNTDGDTNDTVTETQTKHIRDTDEEQTRMIKNEKNEKKITHKRENAERIVELYSINAPTLPKVKQITVNRVNTVNARLKDYSEEEIVAVFRKAEESEFLKHGSNSWRGADFDWIMNPNNFVKILEGRYDNKPQTKPEMQKSHYDFDAMQKFLEDN